MEEQFKETDDPPDPEDGDRVEENVPVFDNADEHSLFLSHANPLGVLAHRDESITPRTKRPDEEFDEPFEAPHLHDRDRVKENIPRLDDPHKHCFTLHLL